MHSGHSGKNVDRHRFIPVHSIVREIGRPVAKCLPAVHALTGCDTTSSFFRIGKKSALTQLRKHIDTLSGLSAFAEMDENDALDIAQLYVMKLYGQKRQCSTLNELRYIFASTTDKTASMLPSTEDAFKQHVLRAQYQASIWCLSHVAQPQIEDPEEHSWVTRTDGQLEPRYYENNPTPIKVRNITHLYCTDEDCTESGKCKCCANAQNDALAFREANNVQIHMQYQVKTSILMIE